VAVNKALFAKRIRAFEKDKEPTIRAYELQKIFMELKRFKPSKTLHDFIGLSSYTHYLRLSKFIVLVHIHDPKIYLRAMIHHNRTLNQFTNNWSYRLYLEFLDEQIQPTDSIKTTINLLFDLAEEVELSVAELISELLLSEIMLLLRQGRISPWVVLHSSVIKSKIMSADPSQQKEFADMFDQDTWRIKFSKFPAAVRTAKQVTKELGI